MTNTTHGPIAALRVMEAALGLMEEITTEQSERKQKFIDQYRNRKLSLWERLTGNVSRLRMSDEEIINHFRLNDLAYIDFYFADNYRSKAYNRANEIFRLCDTVLTNGVEGVEVELSAEDANLLWRHL